MQIEQILYRVDQLNGRTTPADINEQAKAALNRIVVGHLDRLIDLLNQLVLIQQVAEGQDPSLIRDTIANQLDAGKAAHGRHLNQGLIHSRIAEGVSLLLKMDPQHRGQRIGMPSTFLLALG
jgi:hypothetical protein